MRVWSFPFPEKYTTYAVFTHLNSPKHVFAVLAETPLLEKAVSEMANHDKKRRNNNLAKSLCCEETLPQGAWHAACKHNLLSSAMLDSVLFSFGQ